MSYDVAAARERLEVIRRMRARCSDNDREIVLDLATKSAPVLRPCRVCGTVEESGAWVEPGGTVVCEAHMEASQ